MQHMPARRRAPSGCGPQARGLRLARSSHITRYLVARALPAGRGGLQRSASLILSQTLTGILYHIERRITLDSRSHQRNWYRDSRSQSGRYRGKIDCDTDSDSFGIELAKALRRGDA